MDKYKYDSYDKGYFRGGSNININIITCEDNIVILSIIQKYVLHWYHTYLLNIVMDITEAVMSQHLY